MNYLSTDSQKEDNQLAIGEEAKQYIKDHPTMDVGAFYSSVRVYFTTVCRYMCGNFPFGDPVLVNAEVADISKRLEVDFESVTFFTNRYNILMKDCPSLDALEQEFLLYQTDKLSGEVLGAERADVAWAEVGKIVDPITGQKKYKFLPRVMLSILTMFHSNTDCERIFSYVTKTKTKFRPNMNTKTLSALVSHKVNMMANGEKAHSADPSKRVLKAAKSATYNMLNK